MKKILILYAHPRPDRSAVNLTLANAAREVEEVTVVDLYAEYPTFEIDIDREQQRLVDHEVFVFHHPLYWYSCPALLKEWQDLVLEHGFAYGSEGRRLRGKLFFNAVSCGAHRDAYTTGGANCHELRDLLLPFDQTMHSCGVTFLPPFALFTAGLAVDDGRLARHVSDYKRLLIAIATDRLDLQRATKALTLSDDLDGLLLPRSNNS